jgi:hypothetical protein
MQHTKTKALDDTLALYLGIKPRHRIHHHPSTPTLPRHQA